MEGESGSPAGENPARVSYSAETTNTRFHITRRRSYLVVAILFLINLLNYMDRSIVAGVLDGIQDYFKINDSSAGLLQTVFICSYMILAPLFGYLGDRYNRKILMSIGILVWCAVTLAGSFVTKSVCQLSFILMNYSSRFETVNEILLY
ncbi:protein spinster homolog 3-like [Rhincodon typus]|uniref:protein spinster homolog 3-like n=1 Tax=Rhincodon typus TaxID=259920 RepID=UPI00202FD530|nr:protein spinster homolog 3-like [Rhincodon typus]